MSLLANSYLPFDSKTKQNKAEEKRKEEKKEGLFEEIEDWRVLKINTLYNTVEPRFSVIVGHPTFLH